VLHRVKDERTLAEQPVEAGDATAAGKNKNSEIANKVSGERFGKGV